MWSVTCPHSLDQTRLEVISCDASFPCYNASLLLFLVAVLADLDESSPSARATFLSRSSAPPRAGLAGPPPSVPPPAVPYQPPPPLHGLSQGLSQGGDGDRASTGPRQPVYHRLNHDVFFMAAGQVPGLPWPLGARGALGAHMGVRGPLTAPHPAVPPPPVMPAAISPMCRTPNAHPLNAHHVRREVAQGCVDYGWC